MRRAVLLGAIVAAVAVLGAPGTAIAGGGCHSGATEDDATGEEETTVYMMDACFTASVSRVDPGTTVTFVNKDEGLTHNVSGNLWGYYGDMAAGDSFTAVFDDPGVYPFACSYHPGMTGAIVVGDGYGVGDGSTVQSTLPTSAPLEPRSTVAAADGSSAPWIAGAALGGAALGGGIAAGLLRARRRPAAG